MKILVDVFDGIYFWDGIIDRSLRLDIFREDVKPSIYVRNIISKIYEQFLKYECHPPPVFEMTRRMFYCFRYVPVFVLLIRSIKFSL